MFSQFFFAQNSWETLNPKPSSGNNKAIVFNGGTGFVINDSKELISTTDNGETWSIKQAVLSANDLEFSSNVGFIVGDNGYVLKSSDSGATWVVLNIQTTENLNSVSIVGNKVFISSDKKLFTSTDITNFTVKTIDIPNPWITKSVFTTSTEGHIFSQGKIYKSIDSGTTWVQTLSYGSVPNDINLFYFKNKNEGYINFGHREFRKTVDGGETWTSVPGTWLSSIKSMFFANANVGFAVGTYGNIYKTIDNGLNWTNYPENYFGSDGKTLNGVTFINENKGFAVGNNGIILKTNDSGATWVKNSFTYDNINEIQKVDDFYYVQGGDHLYKSEDLKSWQELSSPVISTGYIMDFKMVTPNIAYSVVGNAGSSEIYKSIDGAQTWNLLPNTYGGDYEISFLNENLGFRSGSNLYKTTDGGVTWIKIITPFYFYNVKFLTENLGFGMADSKLYKTIDGGTNWALISGTENVSNYQFLNEQEGFLLIGYEILKTKNGGTSWERISLGKSYQYVNFQNRNVGYLSGQYSDDHSYTDNGGATWKPISKPFPDIQRFVINKQLYLGGTYGKMATTNLVFDKIYLKNNLVSEITAQKANIVGYGSANTGNLENIVFEYSKTDDFVNSLSVNANPDTILEGQNSNLTATINQLSPATDYFVRIKGSNAGIAYYSNILQFKTLEAFSQILTFPKIKSNSVVLNAEIRSLDDKGIQNISYLYGTDENNLDKVFAASPNSVNPNSTANITNTLPDLLKNTRYYIKIKFEYNGMEFLSNVYTFKTINGASLLINPSYNSFFVGFVVSDEEITNIVFQYGSQNFENEIASVPNMVEEGTSRPIRSMYVPNFGMNPVTYYRIKATYLGSVIYSNVEIQRPGIPVDLARNNEIANSDSSATINGYIMTNGLDAYNLKINYGTQENLFTNSVDLTPNEINASTTQNISATLTGLNYTTKYYYQFVGSYNGQQYVSEKYSFSLNNLNTNENQPNNFVLYPNPTPDFVYISQLNEKIKSAEIYDINGRLLKKIDIQKNRANLKFDLSPYPKGIYLIKFYSTKGDTFSKKIIKN